MHNTTALARRRRQPHRGGRQRVHRQRLGGSTRGEHGGRPLRAKQLRRQQRSIVATNSRSPSTTFAGNYWDDYRGYDVDRDGTGDVPHRPVRLFSVIVERQPASLILMRSTFATLLDAAERVLPSLTPDALVDSAPAMKRISFRLVPADDRIPWSCEALRRGRTCCAASTSRSNAVASSGLVGPNGAGKTTLIKMLLGLAHPTARRHSSSTAYRSAPATSYRARIGYMPQIARFPENLTAAELFRMLRVASRRPRRRDRRWARRAAWTRRSTRQAASRAVRRHAAEGQRGARRSCSDRTSSCSTSRPPVSTRSSSATLKDEILARDEAGATVLVDVAHHGRARGPVRRGRVPPRRRPSATSVRSRALTRTDAAGEPRARDRFAHDQGGRMKSVAVTIAGIQARDVIRSRWILVYSGFFLLLTRRPASFLRRRSEGRAQPLDGEPDDHPARHARARDDLRLHRARVHRAAARPADPPLVALRRSLSRGWRFRRRWDSSSASRLPFVMRGGGDPTLRGALATLLLVGAALTCAFTAIAFCVALRHRGSPARCRRRPGRLAARRRARTTASCSPPSRCSAITRSSARCSRSCSPIRWTSRRVLLLMRLDAAALLGIHGCRVRAVLRGQYRRMSRRRHAAVLDRGAGRRRGTPVHAEGFLVQQSFYSTDQTRP